MGQEVTLGLRIRRSFESLLVKAVPSLFDPALYGHEQAWKDDVAASDVRLQWDPDHAPDGSKVGVRGAAALKRREAAMAAPPPGA